MELRYNTEAGFFFKTNMRNQPCYYFTEAPIQLYYKDKSFNGI